MGYGRCTVVASRSLVEYLSLSAGVSVGVLELLRKTESGVGPPELCFSMACQLSKRNSLGRYLKNYILQYERILLTKTFEQGICMYVGSSTLCGLLCKNAMQWLHKNVLNCEK